ncbi:MAG: hypothetical protein JWN04_1047 [Myxococcaceae bacterium]|nr:hypothetical protein [Myxococcaceae bacterium]
MTASDAESWARLRLVEGESSAKKWELVSSVGHTTLTVGSNSDCTWVVRGEGVRPIHFSLHWDGSRLRVADVYSAGEVTIDGTALTSQWRPLSGRVRIEFGKAAMVVETSAALSSSPPRSSEHLLDGLPSAPSSAGTSSKPPASDSRPAARPASSSPRNIGKGTLIGVAPQTLIEAKLLENYQAPSVTSELPDGVSAKDARRAERSRVERERAERERVERPSMKATLVGGIGLAGLGAAHTPIPGRKLSTPAESEAEAKKAAESKLPRTSGPAANATLMGFNMTEALRGIVGTQPSISVGHSVSEIVGGSPLGEPDPRTVQGFAHDNKPSSSAPPNIIIGPAGRRMTQKGVISQPPGGEREAVSQATARVIPAAPGGDRTERIGSAWQELPEDPSRAGRTLRGVQEVDAEADFPRAPRVGGHSDWGREERLSDIPTQMRDPASFESRRPASRGFPWRYVGVLMLTGVAYFAWLYLLDHM